MNSRFDYEIKKAASPAMAGVSAREVKCLLDEWERENVNIHSLIIIRQGIIGCELYKEPLTSRDVHMLYSVSKSVLSAAFGFAVDEGYLSESTTFYDIFPEYCKIDDKYLMELKLIDLLAMRSGKRFSVLKKPEADWLEYFVNGYWEFQPGTDFRYVSENSFVVAAAIVRATGMSLTEFLKPRLYAPLGIEAPFWETSPDNIEAGGWGIQLTPMDFAKFTLCCHNNGAFNGRQVIPAWWIKKATSFVSETKGSQRHRDSQAGYGYGFWRCAGADNSFRCEGLYSQYGISLKNSDACIVITAGAADLQKTLDVLWRHSDKLFIKKGMTGEDVELCLTPSPRAVVSERQETTEAKLDGKLYRMRRRYFLNRIGFPVSSLPMPALHFAKTPGGNMQSLRFSFDRQACTFSWSEDGGFHNEIRASMDGSDIRSRIVIGEMSFDVIAYARWLKKDKLELYIRPLSCVAARRFEFTFKKNKIYMYPDVVPTLTENARVIGEKVKCVLPGLYFRTWVDILVPRVTKILQPIHKGRMISPTNN